MPFRSKVSALLIPFLLVAVQPVPAVAWTPPGFDPSFGHHGVVLADIRGDTSRWGFGQVVDVRQRIVVATTRPARTGGRVLVLFRYLPDGTLDRSFGHGGQVRADVGGFNIPIDVVLTEGGGILVLVLTGTKRDTRGSKIVRFTARGRLDRSFGTEGRVVFPVDEMQASRLTGLPHGRFLAIGVGRHVRVMRFMADGRPDRSFGTAGVVTTSLGTSNDRPVSLSVLASGNLLLVATTARNTSYDNWIFKLVLVRYRPNGTLDRAFGTDGIRRYPMPSWWGAPDAAVDRWGRIVVLLSVSAGSHGCGAATGEIVQRFRRNGDLDRSFSDDGRRAIRAFEVRRLAIEADGGLFVVGQGCTDETRLTWGFGVARLAEDGSWVRSFADRGVAEGAVAGRQGRPSGIALQRDGRLLVAGLAGRDLAVVRYLAS